MATLGKSFFFLISGSFMEGLLPGEPIRRELVYGDVPYKTI